MKKIYLAAALVAAALGVVGWNYFGVMHPIAARLAQDSRNEKVTLWGYHRFGLEPGTLVIDLRGMTDEAAMADVLRALLQSAEAQKTHRYGKVLLAFRGTPKFQLEGAYFQRLGEEFDTQNPVYTMRTMPENVFKMDGAPAYGTWTGGMLGVLGKQMEDFNKFSRDWYLDDALKGRAGAGSTAP
jgi:hypothetical protein